ncbi:fumarylacetoacetate hydrolase family protein [Streptomyces sp. NRRL F-5126]|uniref:fumarylacetoacetate hydrolase family protein n=1 Tax=Streptomyces sp. NRRL F-5126 TaxID=1463857 RepID=UPI000568DCA3|nr:fumarylacetoacetate hydrolase family protein [Streptomyces sp. NRRL F-5126]
MRWVTYLSPADGTEHVGVLDGGRLHGSAGPARLIDLLGLPGDGMARAGHLLLGDPGEVLPAGEVVPCAPVPVPPSIRDFMSFENHVVTAYGALGREVSPVWYEQPVFYFTNPAAVHGPRDPVEISPGSERFDYELEVAAVIGRPGSDIPPGEAAAHIAGFMVLCDWSARDLQAHEMDMGLGPVKGKDSATSFGPFLLTPDELAERRSGRGYDLEMTAHVNGVRYSSGCLADLSWSFEEMVAHASRGTCLLPGDVIGSGTVGTGCVLELSAVHGSRSFPWLRAGDEVRLAVEEMGAVEARVEPARPSRT